ncbi:Susd and RagB outer membrane lipoprotein [Chitinophaga costaii]|uniref:Susd and RagB outer membrane lipoprotein n=1 Tax=Chitinophaga costaii TaxID=1335309 RepID=A0A1C3ZFQ5_9BACT|nr:RagB/SusD family nutrient uptake outer membrane protein [Chitinophaga costaii]PUZ30354.1 SusD/RagB family nutrient-binding outer membrane lipoprotein [Chitinophaga costaii]SCB81237.1 Susd and RagB outer membrane lipoprotein [Chitinophaga costaii]
MKINYIFRKPFAWIAGVAAVLSLQACTKNFGTYNTTNTNLTPDQLNPDFQYIGAAFPQIQSSIYYNYNNTTWEYQLQQNLIADVYSGYMMSPDPFRGNISNLNYSLVDGWNGYPFSLAYANVMSPVAYVARQGARTDAPDFWAVALILKVEAMHRVTDIYGPIPYSHYGEDATKSVYDDQQTVYHRFFLELDTAVTNLKAYIDKYPGKKPFAKFDMVYAGDYTKWLKFANSLRLRLAMRIVKAEPALSKSEAEKALDPGAGGLMETVKEDVEVSGFGIKHPLYTITAAWTDISMSASMESYLVGYKDPRISVYFDPATDNSFAGQFKGIRIGSNVSAKPGYTGFSTLAYSATATFTDAQTPLQLMTSAEVWFLRAEAALRNYANAGGTPEELYEKGITTSFLQWDVGDKAPAYISDNVSKPIKYVDPKNAENNIDAMGTLTIKWDDAAPFETKLERIITQKWIAMFPEGQEAWSEYRRTGYPKLFPVVHNLSGGTISSEIQIRRINFTTDEKNLNAAEVAKAVTLLGGPDNGGTRLWWDKQ